MCVDRMFFSMSVSPDYLQATAAICDAALEYGHLEVVVNMTQMTVSQMTLTSEGESHQHRLHYFAEHVLNWSGVSVVHIGPTAFLDNPIFTWFAAPSMRERNLFVLPFGKARTSPIATSDVARPVAAVLVDPTDRHPGSPASAIPVSPRWPGNWIQRSQKYRKSCRCPYPSSWSATRAKEQLSARIRRKSFWRSGIR